MTIIFGGTFDPPHVGHCTCISAALAKFPGEKLLVIPAFLPATGAQGQKTPVLPFEFRLALCQKSFLQLSDRVEISDIEMHLPIPNYTIQTIDALASHDDEGRSFKVLVGEDQFLNIDKWYRSSDLWNKVDIVVASRPSVGGILDSSSKAAAISRLAYNMGWSGRMIGESEGIWGPKQKRISWLDQLPFAVSSTDLRTRFKEKKSIPLEWLSKNIEDQIPAILGYFEKIRK